MHPDPSHRPPPSRACICAPGAEAGFTIIEVLIAAVLLAVVAAGAALAFVGAVGTSEIQRNRSAAEALAQQNESRLRGYTVGQLSNLNQTLSPVTIDGTQYTVHESATYVSDTSGTPSCTNPSTDYLETTSSVSWNGMPASMSPVTVTGLITPTYGEIGSGSGALAVSVIDENKNPLPGVTVSVSGPGSASGTTASNGCVLFGDLPVGSYTVDVAPSAGTYVDGQTGQAVTASSPDVSTATVNAGTTAAQTDQVQIAPAGSATFSFTDAFPTGVSPSPPPTATAPSVILGSANLTFVCSAQDTGGCPTASNADTSWGTAAWSAPGGQVTAQPVFPYSYIAYAGICASDDPANFGGSDPTVAVIAGGASTPVSVTLPAMIIRLWSGTGTTGAPGTATSAGSEIALPSGSELVVTDTGCSEPYVGGPGVSVPSGDSALPLNTSYGSGAGDTGILTYPGMPDGNYTVCYQNGSQDATASVVNQGQGEIVNIYDSSLATGTCAT